MIMVGYAWSDHYSRRDPLVGIRHLRSGNAAAPFKSLDDSARVPFASGLK